MKGDLYAARLVFAIAALGACGNLLAAGEEEVPNLLSQGQLELRQVSAVTFFSCPRGTQCAVRCNAGADQVSIEYGNVRRLEIGEAEAERLVGIAYLDAVGKGHTAISFFPKPSSCALDDLVIDGISPVEEGTVIRPGTDKDVVFKVERDR